MDFIIRASDYSIAQFRFLKRLLLVHGRWNYRRISKLIMYSFYKNIVLYITQFWYIFFNVITCSILRHCRFSLFNGFSGQSLYERWTLGQYNVIFTFFPAIVFGIFDQDVSAEMVHDYPQLYYVGIKKHHVRTHPSLSLNDIFLNSSITRSLLVGY
jgi:phospholipid-transporting ATPase